MAFDIKPYLRSQIELGLRRFVADLRAIDEKHRSGSYGGVSRSPYDFAYELAEGNRDFAARMRGEERPPMTGIEPVVAPDEFRQIDVACAHLEAGTNEFLAAWDGVSLDVLEEPFAGGKLTPLGLATIVNRHLHYHDAQLNYLQTLLGDTEVHW